MFINFIVSSPSVKLTLKDDSTLYSKLPFIKIVTPLELDFSSFI